MRAYLKRIAIIVVVTLLAVGIRLSDNGLCTFVRDGKYSVYENNEIIKSYDSVPILGSREGNERIDFIGTERQAYTLLKRMSASVIRQEMVEETIIIYAYSPFIKKRERIFGDTVNIMLAIKGEKISIGSPLLCGWY